MSTCNTCGREIKNYGTMMGGIRCPSYCNQEHLMPKFNHMFDIAFTVISDKEDGDEITSAELIKALKARVLTLEAWTNEDERQGEFGLCDTFEMEDVV